MQTQLIARKLWMIYWNVIQIHLEDLIEELQCPKDKVYLTLGLDKVNFIHKAYHRSNDDI